MTVIRARKYANICGASCLFAGFCGRCVVTLETSEFRVSILYPEIHVIRSMLKIADSITVLGKSTVLDKVSAFGLVSFCRLGLELLFLAF